MELADPFREFEGQIEVRLGGARALFTTRSWGDVRTTEREIAERLAVTLVRPKQVHGNTVLSLEDATDRSLTEADAVVTGIRGVGATVLTADCLPIVIASQNAVAAVHAGWRGLESGVIAGAVTALRDHDGGVISAAIGPAAGVCCYQVGEDLHERFAAHAQDFRRGDRLDLKAIAHRQLLDAGVAHVHDTGICTICGDPQLTFSYRREGASTGRQAVIAWLS
jgi:polyphenol oxidase